MQKSDKTNLGELNSIVVGNVAVADLEIIVIISNTLVVFATFLATLYRIKIEREQIVTVKSDVKAKECLESLRKYVKAERGSLKSMNDEEWASFLDYLEKLGER